MAREALGVILLKYNFSMFSQISPTVTRGNGKWAVFLKVETKGGGQIFCGIITALILARIYRILMQFLCSSILLVYIK